MARKFSWKRATGVTKAKSKISRATGIPLTKSGRRRKIKTTTGCGIVIAIFIGLALLAYLIVF